MQVKTNHPDPVPPPTPGLSTNRRGSGKRRPSLGRGGNAREPQRKALIWPTMIALVRRVASVAPSR